MSDARTTARLAPSPWPMQRVLWQTDEQMVTDNGTMKNKNTEVSWIIFVFYVACWYLSFFCRGDRGEGRSPAPRKHLCIEDHCHAKTKTCSRSVASLLQSCGSMSMQYRWFYRGWCFYVACWSLSLWLWPWIIFCFLNCMLILANEYGIQFQLKSGEGVCLLSSRRWGTFSIPRLHSCIEDRRHAKAKTCSCSVASWDGFIMLQLSMWQSCGSMSMQYRLLYRGWFLFVACW